MPLQNEQAEFAELLSSDDETGGLVQPPAHMRIYKNTIISTLVKTLEDCYPLTVKIVGEEFFHFIAKEYIHCYPSRSSNLNDYGEYFSDFLGEYPATDALPYLPEVAKFEWICHTLYLAPTHPGFNPVWLSKVAPDEYGQLHFLLHPASCLMKFQYPLLRIIDLCKGMHDENIDLNEGGLSLLIIRREFDITLVSLDEADYIFLTALSENKKLDEALDAAVQINPDFSLDEKLPYWISNKTLVDCHLG